MTRSGSPSIGPGWASASPEKREALRLKLKLLLDEMDRLDAATNPSATPG
jgi:hypothetical protein